MAVINRIEDALAADAVPKPKRKRTTFYNTAAVAGVADYLAFEYPRGSGLTWRVDPLDYNTGHRIAELQVTLAEIQQDAQRLVASDATSTADAWRAQLRFTEFAREAAGVAGPLLIPTGPARRRDKQGRVRTTLRDRFVYWRRRRAWKRGVNPLAHATDREVTEVVGFLASCLMISPSRVNRAALN